MKKPFATQRIYTRPGKINNASGDFVCLSCGTFVSAGEALSGVRNRNHCPYCLASRHMDQFEAGDRLSACKARMMPVGLTLKRVNKKYAGHSQGELMLVHLCEGCGKISINRIAADDLAEVILSVLEKSAGLSLEVREMLAQEGVTLVNQDQADLVRQSLFGTTLRGG